MLQTWDLSSSSHSESTNLLEDGKKAAAESEIWTHRFGLIKQMEEEVTDHSGIWTHNYITHQPLTKEVGRHGHCPIWDLNL